MIWAAGITVITMQKLTGMMIAANIPNARIGRMSEPALERNAIEVVLEVTRMALNDLFQLYAMRLCKSSEMKEMFSDYLHASQNTNMSSAAIPNTMKITI